jgi:hypothetical protein
MATGLLVGSTEVLMVAMGFALLGAILPQHPFDYLYNGMVRHWWGGPAVPLRTPQARFACGVATAWLGIVLWLFSTGAVLAGNVMGGLLVAVAILVTTTDYCVPSLIFNALFRSGNTAEK